MIIGRRRILLAALVVILGAAVFVNWYFGSNELRTVAADDSNVSKNIGDAQYVSSARVKTNGVDNLSEYFEEARLERRRARDEALDGLKSIDSVESSTAATALTECIQKENNIENLVKAKGIDECIATISDEGVSVVVQCDELNDVLLLQIKEIANKQTMLPFENITVIKVK